MCSPLPGNAFAQLTHHCLPCVFNCAISQGQAATTAAGGGYPGQRAGMASMQQYYLEGMRPEAGSMLPRGPAPPAPVQQTRTIRNDVNLKKGTMRLVRDPDSPDLHYLEFTFDASTDCTIRTFYYAEESVGADGKLSFAPMKPSGACPPDTRTKGLGQKYRTPHPLDISEYTKAELQCEASSSRFPIVVCLESSAISAVNAQTTYANAVFTDTNASAVPLKQKIQVGATIYELQEIYGIEGSSDASGGDGGDHNSRECVICMTEMRDTTVLPCRHMCMCSECANVMRMQSEKCPICRSPIESLLQIKISSKAPAAETAAA